MNKTIKEIARYILFAIKRKSYKSKVYNNVRLVQLRENSAKEYFYGYYDKSPERNGKVLCHEMNDGFVKIIVKNMVSGDETVIGETKAQNWQFGARSMWIDDDIVAYNDFDGNRYVCQFYSITDKKIVKTYNQSILDYSDKGYYLGINFQRLRPYAFDYAYYCLPEMQEQEYVDYQRDGVWKVDVKTGNTELILSIQQILDYEKIDRFDKGKHFVNHIMISPKGDAFIFIHRYFVGKERYDRLMYYDFKQLKCLLDDKHQSHYCWLNDTTVFGYGEYKGQRGFHKIDTNTFKVEICEKLTAIHPKDGHPTVHGDWIVVDCYPNLSRMEVLSAYNIKTDQYINLLEVFHDLKHRDYSRCDLHPRFSLDGKRVYFDTIYTGKRMLCYADVSKLLH